MSNRIFVAYKPANMVCNHFLGRIKRRYGVKKAGFSGTLDPFAKGVLIIAFGQYTKLFRFLKKTPKTYRATLWLGCQSESLDVENVQNVQAVKAHKKEKISEILTSFKGKVSYNPPKFSAKKLDGKRAYELARSGKEFELKSSSMEVYDIKLLNYAHPFLSFEVSVSEGAYIRSLGELIAKKLGCFGALSALERVREGEFLYDDEKALNPLEYLDLKENEYLSDAMDVKLGKKLSVKNFKIQKNGFYMLKFADEFAIIQIQNEKVIYELNKVKIC